MGDNDKKSILEEWLLKKRVVKVEKIVRYAKGEKSEGYKNINIFPEEDGLVFEELKKKILWKGITIFSEDNKIFGFTDRQSDAQFFIIAYLNEEPHNL